MPSYLDLWITKGKHGFVSEVCTKTTPSATHV